ncbi:MAG: FadR family transcriptional regulator [Chloroflexi bacterium]|nr:FadR family transcriptional regulator [Chloroflexota bacterium]
MLDKLPPHASVKELALYQIKQFILHGDLGEDNRLPPERELAERLGVGRNSLREALKVLEALGLIESRVGEGTFVINETGATIGQTIGFKLAVRGGTLVEINDARLMIEPSAARAAAQRASREELREIAHELHKMDIAIEFNDFLVADMNFHRLIAKASQNAMVYQVVKNLVDMLEATLAEVHLDTIGSISEGEGTHHLVYASIVARDPDAAFAAMAQHMEYTTEFWTAIARLVASQEIGDAK